MIILKVSNSFFLGGFLGKEGEEIFQGDRNVLYLGPSDLNSNSK